MSEVEEFANWSGASTSLSLTTVYHKVVISTQGEILTSNSANKTQSLSIN
ncbi:hypothetical protein [Flavobacterium sp. N502536]|nr:hypothetical protein [Flavobacterium sp. N502536]